MIKTMGRSRREVGVRLSQRSIGEGRKDKIPHGDDAADDNSVVAFLLLSIVLVLLDADPSCRESAGVCCSKCSGEFGGRSSSDACPARSNFEQGVMWGKQRIITLAGSAVE